jgi:RimJ/RimL family protein N-acetyltransferase
VLTTLETERLILRPFVVDDLDALVRLQAEEAFWWYPLRRGMTAAETGELLGRLVAGSSDPERPIFHAVVLRSTGTLIGWAGLSVPDFLPEILPAIEVGWRLGAEFWGHGYATEAAAAALDWGFGELGYERIVAIFEPENVASGQVMDRLGFGRGRATVEPERDLPILVRVVSAADWHRRAV